MSTNSTPTLFDTPPQSLNNLLLASFEATIGPWLVHLNRFSSCGTCPMIQSQRSSTSPSPARDPSPHAVQRVRWSPKTTSFTSSFNTFGDVYCRRLQEMLVTFHLIFAWVLFFLPEGFEVLVLKQKRGRPPLPPPIQTTDGESMDALMGQKKWVPGSPSGR